MIEASDEHPETAIVVPNDDFPPLLANRKRRMRNRIAYLQLPADS
jgi:hypothetical protein